MGVGCQQTQSPSQFSSFAFSVVCHRPHDNLLWAGRGPWAILCAQAVLEFLVVLDKFVF